VLPTERREVDEKAVGNIFDLAQGGDRAVQIAGIPQNVIAVTRRFRPEARCCWFS
jgi:hypothetical protein